MLIDSRRTAKQYPRAASRRRGAGRVDLRYSLHCDCNASQCLVLHQETSAGITSCVRRVGAVLLPYESIVLAGQSKPLAKKQQDIFNRWVFRLFVEVVLVLNMVLRFLFREHCCQHGYSFIMLLGSTIS